MQSMFCGVCSAECWRRTNCQMPWHCIAYRFIVVVLLILIIIVLGVIGAVVVVIILIIIFVCL